MGPASLKDRLSSAIKRDMTWILYLLLVVALPCMADSSQCQMLECKPTPESFLTECPENMVKEGIINCGEPFCLLFSCVYTHSQAKCCPRDDGNCQWFDFLCNWNNIKDIFEGGIDWDELEDFWGNFTEDEDEDVLEDLADPSKFKNLKEPALKALKGLLWALKSVAGMTADQFCQVIDDIHDMNTTELETFLGNVNHTALEEGLSCLAESDWNWTVDQVDRFVDRLEGHDTWGGLAEWATDQIEAIGSFIGDLNVTEIKEFAVDAFVLAENIVNMTLSQLSDLWDHWQDNLTQHEFGDLLEGIDDNLVMS